MPTCARTTAAATSSRQRLSNRLSTPQCMKAPERVPLTILQGHSKMSHLGAGARLGDLLLCRTPFSRPPGGKSRGRGARGSWRRGGGPPKRGALPGGGPRKGGGPPRSNSIGGGPRLQSMDSGHSTYMVQRPAAAREQSVSNQQQAAPAVQTSLLHPLQQPRVEV